MTTITPFVQAPNAPFQFQPTLDGQVYTAVVTWLLFGRRYYINLFAQNGQRVFTLPLIGSPVGKPIQSLTWAAGWVTAVTSEPHGYEVLNTIALTVKGCSPDEYNGRKRVLVTKANEFSYLVNADPGPVSSLGIVSYDVNLAGGYFNESSLVFRDSLQQFEVDP